MLVQRKYSAKEFFVQKKFLYLTARLGVLTKGRPAGRPLGRQLDERGLHHDISKARMYRMGQEARVLHRLELSLAII